MSLTQKLTTFVARCGTPAKFVAKTVLGYAVPGSGPLIDLIEKLIDCAQKTAKDNLEVDGLASKADLKHIETMFDVLLGDMKDVVEKLKPLEAVPEIAKETLRTALATEKHCLAAAKTIRAQGMQLSVVQAELKKLSAGQEELLDLQRRFFGSHLDYIEEQRQHNVSPSQLNERLKKIEEAIFANWHGDHERAEVISDQLCRDQPVSAVLAVAKAATHASGHNFVVAAESLAHASRLCPGDAKLAEMSRVATHLSRGATPVDPRPDAKKRPKPGETLDGWLLEKLLGFGGWGQVFLARKGDHVRALKIMHAELSKDAEFVKRFKREMGMLMGLGSHPHLVHIDPEHLFDKADDWNCWYYVMEFVEGITLEEYLRRSGPLTLEQAHVLFDGIADGLKIAHQRGIIHRDIKPANILIRPKSQAAKGRGVLVDFGLAGLVDAKTSGAGYTALFAAPEQMREGVADCRSDVYSLAATVYYSLLYNDPEKRGRYKAKLLPAEVPAEMRDFLERCLDNDSDERPKDAAAFLQDWCKPKATEIAQPTPPPPVATPPKPTRKPGDIITNALGMKFAWVPPGSFMMGSPKSEQEQAIKDGASAEWVKGETQHKVTLTKGFCLGVHQVTQELWQAIMGSNPSHFKGEKNLPVENVSWEDCQQFLKGLSEKEGHEYRFPTEAEWEYACRAGTTTPFYFGETISTDQANYAGKYVYGKGKKGIYRVKTTPVGSLPYPNAWGLYDMHGNVWEWCADLYADYPAGDQVDPEGAPTGESRVLRGGSFNYNPRVVRSASRGWDAPTCRDKLIGVRVARTFTT